MMQEHKHRHDAGGAVKEAAIGLGVVVGFVAVIVLLVVGLAAIAPDALQRHPEASTSIGKNHDS